MAAGTIALTNNSTAVTGTGTAFTSDLAVNGFIVSNVGGTAYTLGIKSIESDTGLTLTQAYNGPTGDGYAFDYVPSATLNLITSALAAQVSYAIRGLNLDKNNWQQVFSDAESVTVTLPDGTSASGPSWGKISGTLSSIDTALAAKASGGANDDITSLSGLTTALSIGQGGTGESTADAARTALGVAYGTSEGTVAQGNDSRLDTVNEKTGGTITSGIAVTGAVTCNDLAGFFATGVNSVSGGATTTGLRIQAADRDYDIYCQYQYVASQYHQFRIVMNSTAPLIVRSNGEIYARSFNPTSDGRLKLNKEVLTDALNKVETLTGYTFDLFGERKSGLIAQDIQKVLPEVVSETFVDHTLDDGTVVTNGLSVDYGAMTGLLVEAIKELNQQVFELKKRLHALDGLDA